MIHINRFGGTAAMVVTRRWLPGWLFAFLCWWPRGWMLVQPFRWVLFRHF